MTNATKFTDYSEAKRFAIKSKSFVCVLARSRNRYKTEYYLVAKTMTDQAELIRQGYKPA